MKQTSGLKKSGEHLIINDGNGGATVLKLMDKKAVDELVQAIKGLRYFDHKRNLMRTTKSPQGPGEIADYIMERRLVQKFEPIDHYLECAEEDRNDFILNSYYATCPGAFMIEAFVIFKKQFLQLVDIYQNLVKNGY